eukprot:SAG11_NODE_144_length_14830_cov_17.955943_3_plen_193_part_00
MNRPHSWQHDIIEIITPAADDRTIHWIWDADVGKGKSKLFKFLCWGGAARKFGVAAVDAKRIPLGSATQVKSAVLEAGPHKTFLLDLPRVRGKDEKLTELFSAIEEIKNGWVSCPMYGKFKEMFFSPPHVVVVSNDKPRQDLASQDRWKTYKIVPVAGVPDGEDYELLPGEFFWDPVAEQDPSPTRAFPGSF